MYEIVEVQQQQQNQQKKLHLTAKDYCTYSTSLRSKTIINDPQDLTMGTGHVKKQSVRTGGLVHTPKAQTGVSQ